jgi:hypothetical protein
MRIAYHVCRLIFGLWFVYAGAEYFLPQFVQPLGESAQAQAFTVAMIESGLFAWVKAAEFVSGVLCLANRWMAFIVPATLPISIAVAYWNFVLEGGFVPFLFGIVTLGLNLALLWPWRKLYRPLFAWKPGAEYGLR